MDIREYLANNRLITDGAMGTWYDRLTGYKGNLAERANLENPQQIRNGEAFIWEPVSTR